MLAFGFTAAPAPTAFAASPINDATSLAAAFTAGGTVTLDTDITVTAAGPALAVSAGLPVTLDLNGHALTATGNSGTPGIRVSAGTELVIIDGATGGSLTATGGQSAAGIGGGFFADGGTVTINRGTVAAQGGHDAAGIGGGSFGQGATTTINGGTVTALGGTDPGTETGGAGIGGGFLGTGGNTTINGGDVTATGGGLSAGIGGGYGGNGGATTINGGTTTAHGAALAAGIGGGEGGTGGTTTITGGTVTAEAGAYGSAIGGGQRGAGGVVAITGGVVTATGGAHGTAIGGGFWADGGTLSIGAGAQVTVSASPVPDSFLIGGGEGPTAFGSLTNAGTLTITQGSTLLIPSGTTALNSGTIINAGTLAGAGTLTNTGAIVNSGTVDPGLGTTTNSFVISFDLSASPDSSPAPIAPLRVYANTLAAAQVTLPTQPAIPHHSFDWFTNASPKAVFTSTTILTGDITLYATWTLDTHTVTFDAQGGSAVASVTADYGTTITAPTAPTFAGHTFTGWTTDAAGTDSWNFATSTVTGITTLYAQWTLDTHLVRFDAQGGSAVKSVTVDYGTPVGAPRTPTRAGFTFDGWFTAATDGTEWDFAHSVTGDLTLYAQWTEVAVVTPPTSTPTPTPTVAPKPVDPQLASTGFDGGAAGFGALALVLAGLAGVLLRRRHVSSL